MFDAGCVARPEVSPCFRRALWISLVVDAVIFAVGIVRALRSGSVSLLADAVDFGRDAGGDPSGAG